MDIGRQGHKCRRTVPGEFSANEIACLNPGRPLVDRADAGIAKVLRGAGFLDESHAAVYLDAERGDFDAASPCTSP